jgi:hypothetical protein
MKRVGSIVVVLGLIGSAGAIAAATMNDDSANSSTCPDGTTEWSSINELAGPGAASMEDAVRIELESHQMDASDDAIAAAVGAAGSAGNVGDGTVVVETSEGVRVSMTLTPLNPGWAVEASSWCAPNDE